MCGIIWERNVVQNFKMEDKENLFDVIAVNCADPASMALVIWETVQQNDAQ